MVSADKHLTLDLRSYSAETNSHQHDYHQLVLPVSGLLDMTVGQYSGKVTSQHAAVVAAGENHGFAGSDDNCFVVADIPDALAPEVERLPAFISLSPALIQYVCFLHQQLQQKNSASSQRQMLLLLIQLLHEQQDEPLNLDRRITTARNYLDNHYCEPVSLSYLSGIASLSPRQLSELFRKQLGMTPQQYLIEKRMQQAWQLLETGQLSIQQVAEAVGYTSLAAFSDRFRKHFDIPPSFFRRSGK
ncbi:AraC family transcriptional regulator [Amphritea japonica]|uniref:AraC family transcriptional regulator n=1 Tax=Amphritea japonica ATCC BAA-1530 TaxID=1278309 RepID=A0A7R6SR38_9GAMM|nr:AraC family transcriptional regulator [Amphritea japonica]BBB24824.1 AraC family transcriptional regulator [Amphritea japonica ATCC BAA-1530]